MAFKQRVKSLLKEGHTVKIIFGGMEYEGRVVEFENLNPQDAHVTLENNEGTQYILPISNQMAIEKLPVTDGEVDEVDEVDEIDEPTPKMDKKTNKSSKK